MNFSKKFNYRRKRYAMNLIFAENGKFWKKTRLRDKPYFSIWGMGWKKLTNLSLYKAGTYLIPSGMYIGVPFPSESSMRAKSFSKLLAVKRLAKKAFNSFWSKSLSIRPPKMHWANVVRMASHGILSGGKLDLPLEVESIQVSSKSQPHFRSESVNSYFLLQPRGE